MGDNRPGGFVAAASELSSSIKKKINVLFSLAVNFSLSKVCVRLCDREASAGGEGLGGCGGVRVPELLLRGDPEPGLCWRNLDPRWNWAQVEAQLSNLHAREETFPHAEEGGFGGRRPVCFSGRWHPDFRQTQRQGWAFSFPCLLDVRSDRTKHGRSFF